MFDCWFLVRIIYFRSNLFGACSLMFWFQQLLCNVFNYVCWNQWLWRWCCMLACTRWVVLVKVAHISFLIMEKILLLTYFKLFLVDLVGVIKQYKKGEDFKYLCVWSVSCMQSDCQSIDMTILCVNECWWKWSRWWIQSLFMYSGSVHLCIGSETIHI